MSDYNICQGISINNDRNVEKDQCKFAFVLAVMMVLSVYLLPFATFVSFGEVLIILSIIGLVIKFQKIYIYKNIALYLFVFYGAISSILISILLKADMFQTISRLIRDGFYWIVIYVFGYSFLNFKVFVKWVKIICTCLSIYIIVQFLVYMMIGYVIPGFPMNAVVAESCTAMDIYQNTIESAIRNGYLKANGFLTEGAHCGQALAIGVVLLPDFNAIEKTSRKTYYLMVLYSLAGILTFSATGMVLIGFVWFMVLVKVIKSGRINKKIAVPTIIFLGLILLFLFFAGDKLNLHSVLNRLLSATSSSTADNSSFLRLYRGFAFWHGLPIENKLFGIGFGNFGDLSYLSKGIMGSPDNEYMNSISYILVSSGVIGELLYAIYIITMYKQSNSTGRVMTFLLILMSLSSSPYSSVYWIWMTLGIIYNIKTKEEELCHLNY